MEEINWLAFAGALALLLSLVFTIYKLIDIAIKKGEQSGKLLSIIEDLKEENEHNKKDIKNLFDKVQTIDNRHIGLEEKLFGKIEQLFDLVNKLYDKDKQ